MSHPRQTSHNFLCFFFMNEKQTRSGQPDDGLRRGTRPPPSGVFLFNVQTSSLHLLILRISFFLRRCKVRIFKNLFNNFHLWLLNSPWNLLNGNTNYWSDKHPRKNYIFLLSSLSKANNIKNEFPSRRKNVFTFIVCFFMGHWTLDLFHD